MLCFLHQIAMELCGGGSVQDLYQGDYSTNHVVSTTKLYAVLRKPLTEEQIIVVTHDILAALDYLHTKMNIIHRDIKAANFLLTDDGKVKLSMFRNLIAIALADLFFIL